MHGFSHHQGLPWEDKVLIHGLKDLLLVLGLQWRRENSLHHCVLQVINDFLVVFGIQWHHKGISHKCVLQIEVQQDLQWPCHLCLLLKMAHKKKK